VHVEPGAELANLGFELSHPSEQLPHEFGQLGTLRATGGRFWYRVVHKPFIGRRLQNRQKGNESREIVLAFLKGSGRLLADQTDGV